MSRQANGTCIVTGAASGIGKAIATHLVDKGWRVAIADHDEENGEKLAQALGENALFVKSDVTSYEDQARLFAKVYAWGNGQIDLFIANAGIADKQSMALTESFDPASAEAPPPPLNIDALKVDLEAVVQGVWLFIHYASKTSARSRRIIITSSSGGIYAMPVVPLYTAAKHALVGLTRALATNLRAQNILVNAICPGFVLTNLAPQALKDAMPDQYITPMVTVVKAYDAILSNDLMTGQIIEVSLDDLYFREQPSYSDNSQRFMFGESLKTWENALSS